MRKLSITLLLIVLSFMTMEANCLSSHRGKYIQLKIWDHLKKDIVFIIILIRFGAIIAVGLITGINDLAGDTAQDTNLVFRFSVTDGIILGGITVAYIVTHIRKGRK